MCRGSALASWLDAFDMASMQDDTYNICLETYEVQKWVVQVVFHYFLGHKWIPHQKLSRDGNAACWMNKGVYQRRGLAVCVCV